MMMLVRIAYPLLLIVGSLVSAVAPVGDALAQDGRAAIVATGLTNPRGFVWDADGAMLIAEAGAGGETEASGEVEIPAPAGPYTGGHTARVVRAANGCVVPVTEDLPSAQSASGEVVGVEDVALLDGTLYALVSGGGAAHGNTDQQNGVYRITDDGAVTLVADLGDWLRSNPVAEPPISAYDPEGTFTGMVAVDGELWVVESNSEQLLAITAAGEVRRVVDFSAGNTAPVAIAASPDGGVYLGERTQPPFPEGGARVLEVDSEGAVTVVWTGLTAISGIAVDSSGRLYAAQLSTARTRPPYLQPGSGSIVQQTGEATFTTVATGLNFPTGLEIGADGALYTASPAIGASDGTGLIVRIVPGDSAIMVDPGAVSAQVCGDGTGGGPPSVATGVPVGGDGTGDPAAPTAQAPPPSEVIVRIFDFGFDNASLTVPVGATVIWANTGVQHTVLAIVNGERYVDSGILESGDTFSFTFTEAGTWDYVCGLHPQMTGQIIVE